MNKFAKQSVIKHPETGDIITTFTKDDANGVEQTYGTVRVDETVLMIANGFTSKQSRTAFITLDADALEILSPHIKDGHPYPMEGKIVVKETFTPQWVGHSPKINPTTNENVLVDGKLVYRSSDFSSDMNQSDVLLRDSGAPVIATEQIDESDIS